MKRKWRLIKNKRKVKINILTIFQKEKVTLMLFFSSIFRVLKKDGQEI